MIRVVGLDLSLSNSGVVRFDDDGTEKPTCASVISHAGTPQSVEEELERIRDMAARVFERAMRGVEISDDVLFVFEGPALNASYSGKSHERAGLWWILALNLRRHGRLVAVSPNTVKSYWAHNGNASKDRMTGWARHRYPELHVDDHNVADALALAHMGARHRGIIPTPRPPEVDSTFLRRVAWPN